MIVKSFFNDVIFYLFDTQTRFSLVAANRTEKPIPYTVRLVNRVPVYETNDDACVQ